MFALLSYTGNVQAEVFETNTEQTTIFEDPGIVQSVDLTVISNETSPSYSFESSLPLSVLTDSVNYPGDNPRVDTASLNTTTSVKENLASVTRSYNEGLSNRNLIQTITGVLFEHSLEVQSSN